MISVKLFVAFLNIALLLSQELHEGCLVRLNGDPFVRPPRSGRRSARDRSVRPWFTGLLWVTITTTSYSS